MSDEISEKALRRAGAALVQAVGLLHNQFDNNLVFKSNVEASAAVSGAYEHIAKMDSLAEQVGEKLANAGELDKEELKELLEHITDEAGEAARNVEAVSSQGEKLGQFYKKLHSIAVFEIR